jgi:hypothetical protein
MTVGDDPYILQRPHEPPLVFCSLTCCWSWLREHVETQAQAVRTLERPAVPMPVLTTPRVSTSVRRTPPRRAVAVPEAEAVPDGPGFHLIAGDANRLTHALLKTPGFAPVPDLFANRCPICGVKLWVCRCPKE